MAQPLSLLRTLAGPSHVQASGLILGFFRDATAARALRQKLAAQGFARTALITKTDGASGVDDTDAESESGTHIESRRAPEAAATGAGAIVGGLVTGVLFPALAARSGALPVEAARALRILSGAAGTVLGAAIGRAGTRVAGTQIGVDASTLALYERWTVAGEVVLIVQVGRDKLEEALALLRDEDDAPVTFVVRPHARDESALLARLADGTASTSKAKAAAALPPRDDRAPALSGDELRAHAARAARKHTSLIGKGRAKSLLGRLQANERTINGVCRGLAEAARLDQPISLSGEWLLDNAYNIQRQIADVRRNLSRQFYRELPVLIPAQAKENKNRQNTQVPLGFAHEVRGVTRAYAIAHDLAAHTDGRLDELNIESYLQAYQEAAPLTMGELWVLPLMFRVALVEQLRRLTLQTDRRQRDRERADFWANRLLAASRSAPDSMPQLLADLRTEQKRINDHFVDRLISGLYDEEFALVTVRSWVEATLKVSFSDILARESRREAADQIAVANIIGSLRALGQMDWRESFERLSHVHKILGEDPAQVYEQMDFETRDRYRHSVERIARGAASPEQKLDLAPSELDIARRTIQAAQNNAPKLEASTSTEQASTSNTSNVVPAGHIGFHLIDDGVRELEHEVAYRPEWRTVVRRAIRNRPEPIYFGALAIGTTGALWAIKVLARRSGVSLPLATQVLALLPASELAMQIANFGITKTLEPRALPKMLFESGVPDEWRTLVGVPMMLSGEDAVRDEVAKLEVRYLANPDPNLRFALLSDFTDAPQRTVPEDAARLEAARSAIEELNRRHPVLQWAGPDGEFCTGDRFLLLGRDRRWSESEGKWMGYERKRGKLEELNALLCGEASGAPDALHVLAGNGDSLEGVRFAITLDADTQLPRDTARRLIETLAHPLNRPVVEGNTDLRGPHGPLVKRGYTVIQPRVSTSLPSATETRFSRLFTDATGSDPYTHAISDVYQDLFGEGSYHGKGIYDVRAFHQVLAGRFPPVTLLSHDLLEGAHVRVGLASDIELFDDFPPNYLAYARRNHRWVRGDWQILDWALPSVPSAEGRVRNPLSPLNKWKVADNLRRSKAPEAAVALLSVAWLAGPVVGSAAQVLVAAGLAVPAVTGFISWLPSRTGGARVIANELRLSLVRAALGAALLPHTALLNADAIVRTLGRKYLSRRDLLEWQTAQDNYRDAGARERAFVSRMAGSTAWAAGNALLLLRFQPASLPLAAPMLLLWASAPLLVRWLSGGRERPPVRELSGEDQVLLRRLSRQTWRYFDDFVGPQTRWLPPDNYQEQLNVEIAQRTSPTNMGLWLLSLLAAHDFGYIPLDEIIVRAGETFDTLEKLERHHGHFYNWYDAQSTLPLKPRYVSTVDSGNLLGSMWALAQGVRQVLAHPLIDASALNGLDDVLGLLQESLDAAGTPRTPAITEPMAHLERLLRDPVNGPVEYVDRLRACEEPVHRLIAALAEVPQGKTTQRERDRANLEATTTDPRFTSRPAAYWAAQLYTQVSYWTQQIDRYGFWIGVLRELPDAASYRPDDEILRRRDDALKSIPSLEDLAMGRVPAMTALLELRSRSYLSEASRQWLNTLDREFGRGRWLAGEMRAQAENVIDRAQKIVDETQMRFLFDDERELFSIGFNVEEMRRDNSYYDLLASECRLASFVCIARGEIPLEHWVALGRRYGLCYGRAALQSWSGTMFEYLMPLLLMKPFQNSMLENACRTAVLCQADYGRERGVPWGISESAYSALDANKTYQYHAFGVPGLGLKRGLEDDLVVAPYASVMALLVEPQRAMANLRALEKIGMRGEYGFYESIDYSRQRLRDDDPSTTDAAGRGVIVRCFMVHHQGMALLALDNVLHEGAMQARFHADPRVQAAEPLLHERIPVAPSVLREVLPERAPARLNAASLSGGEAVDRLSTPDTPLPRVQLLSNGEYSLCVTNAGGGYSRWKETEITRFRADSTRDAWGQWIYVRDSENNALWSAAHQPLRKAAKSSSVLFTGDKVEFHRRDGDIETVLEVIVVPDAPAELRRVTLVNHSNRPREVELTSFAEVALAPHAGDRAHPAFAKLFVQTEVEPDLDAILAWRRPRSNKEKPIWAAHAVVCQQVLEGGAEDTPFEFETDRSKFLGRGRSAENPQALTQVLEGATGAVLDPCFALRKKVRIEPGARATAAFVTTAGDTREQVLAVVARLREGDAVARAFDSAWTHSQLELHHLRIQAEDAQRFQHLASFLLFPHPALRAPAKRLKQNFKGQSGLWAYGISGDLPIVVVAVDDARDLGVVRQVLAAHSFWRARGLKCDLVLLNEQAGGYNQTLTEQLSNLAMSMSHHTGLNQPGGVFLRTADTLPEEDLTLLFTIARVVLVAARGSIAKQLANAAGNPAAPPRLSFNSKAPEEPSPVLPFLRLPYFNGWGGFTENGEEYAIFLDGKDRNQKVTPAPWSNVLANPDFGMLLTESGQGFCWSGNSQSNRLTPWSNDPVSDTSGDAIYIRDEESGVIWTPTPLPIRENDPYRARHGQGYTVFEHNSHAIEQEMVQYVPCGITDGVEGDEFPPLRVSILRLRNRSSRRRRLSVTAYAEWILGTTREETQPHVWTEWDAERQVLRARNPYHPDFGHRVAFLAAVESARSYTGDRTAFLGRNGSPAAPDALRRRSLGERVGAGLDACGAIQVLVTLEPGEERDVTFLLGQCDNVGQINAHVAALRKAGAPRKYFGQTRDWWDDKLETLQVETPIQSVNFLVNKWLGYQTLSCRIWGRSAFYQSGGAYGFRDQLQDVMAMVYSAPHVTREQIIRASQHQFVEGDVQHWWHPPGGAGVRTRITDDLLFLPYVTAHYIRTTGDRAILDEVTPFLGGRLLEPDEHETYLPPEPCDESATIFEHCRRAIEKGCTIGPNGMPLMGAGDWNDGMNRVGIGGKGESVWLAWFAIEVLNQFAEVCDVRGEADLAVKYRKMAVDYAASVEKSAWDGEWYVRAFFDDGTPLGSHLSDEAQIDALPQAWSVLSDAGDPARRAIALKSMEERLVKRDSQIILLFTPSFDKTTTDPGYIKGYLPGVRENGGQYTHAAVWAAMSFARAGEGRKGVELLTMLNPVEHAKSPDGVQKYKVEPYVVCADIYNLENQVGRGGWTWYTGSASWMYRAWVEEVLGFRKLPASFKVEPNVSPDWTNFSLRYKWNTSTYSVRVENPDGIESGVLYVELDGTRLLENEVPLVDDGREHAVMVRMGHAAELNGSRNGVVGIGAARALPEA
jgi:cyclic beta-1,2-glucan synthetase